MKDSIIEMEKTIHSLQKTLLQKDELAPGLIRVSAPITRIRGGGTVIIRKVKKENGNKKSNIDNIDLGFDIPGIEI